MRYYRAAIQAGSTDSDAFAVSARDRMDQSSTGGIDYPGDCVSDGDKALAEIRQAIALDRGEIYYWEMLGRAFFVAPTVSLTNIAELSQAITDNPSGLEVRYYRGLLYSRLGRMDECRADVQYVSENKQTSSFRRRWAYSYLAHLDFDSDSQKVNALTRARRFGDARAMLDQRLEDGVDPMVREDYFSLQRFVDEAEDWRRVADFREKQAWPDLLEATTSFLKKYPLSNNRGQMESWQRLARREIAISRARGQP